MPGCGSFYNPSFCFAQILFQHFTLMTNVIRISLFSLLLALYFLLHLREIIFLIHACVLFNLIYQQYCYLMQERLISYRACFSSGNVCIIGHVILLGFQMQHFSSVIPDLFFIPRNDYILAIFIRIFYIYTA